MTASRDTWTTRDYPVLVAVAEQLESTHGAPLHAQGVEGFPPDEVAAAFVALIPTYAEGKIQRLATGALALAVITGLTEKGRRAAGLWPAEGTDHTFALIEAIRAAADQAETEDERGRLRKAADALAGAAGRITEGAIAAVVAGAVSAGM